MPGISGILDEIDNEGESRKTLTRFDEKGLIVIWQPTTKFTQVIELKSKDAFEPLGEHP